MRDDDKTVHNTCWPVSRFLASFTLLIYPLPMVFPRDHLPVRVSSVDRRLLDCSARAADPLSSMAIIGVGGLNEGWLMTAARLSSIFERRGVSELLRSDHLDPQLVQGSDLASERNQSILYMALDATIRELGSCMFAYRQIERAGIIESYESRIGIS